MGAAIGIVSGGGRASAYCLARRIVGCAWSCAYGRALPPRLPGPPCGYNVMPLDLTISGVDLPRVAGGRICWCLQCRLRERRAADVRTSGRCRYLDPAAFLWRLASPRPARRPCCTSWLALPRSNGPNLRVFAGDLDDRSVGGGLRRRDRCDARGALAAGRRRPRRHGGRLRRGRRWSGSSGIAAWTGVIMSCSGIRSTSAPMGFRPRAGGDTAARAVRAYDTVPSSVR